MHDLTGIFTALVTPFDGEGRVNHDVLAALVEKNMEDGVTGFYVGGSTGEAFLLTEEERRAILETVAKTVRGRCTVISHVGAIATDEACRLAVHAAGLGVDAVSAISPFYYQFSFPEIQAHYNAICDACGLPMIVYNFPALSGITLTPENIASLRENPHVVGVKHTSMDLFGLERMKAADPALLVYNGHDEVFLAGLTMGADGAVGTTYNFMGGRFVRIRECFLAGRLTEAQRLQREANEIIGALVQMGVFQGTKYLLARQGIDCGTCRRPFHALSERDMRTLDALAETYL